LLVLVPVVIVVTPLAPRPASRWVVAAPRRCVASCAGVRILSQELAKPCISELSDAHTQENDADVGTLPRVCKEVVVCKLMFYWKRLQTHAKETRNYFMSSGCVRL